MLKLELSLKQGLKRVKKYVGSKLFNHGPSGIFVIDYGKLGTDRHCTKIFLKSGKFFSVSHF